MYSLFLAAPTSFSSVVLRQQGRVDVEQHSAHCHEGDLEEGINFIVYARGQSDVAQDGVHCGL